MSTYRYENANCSIDIRESAGDALNAFIWIHEGRKEAAILFPKKDAPTVAAELLKAAGQESAIVAKSKSEVVERPFGQIHCGKVAVHADVDYASLLTTAADYIAIAEWIKSKLAEAKANADKEAEAAKKLQERRDALAKKFTKGICYYESAEFSTKAAIDYIIEDGK